MAAAKLFAAVVLPSLIGGGLASVLRGSNEPLEESLDEQVRPFLGLLRKDDLGLIGKGAPRVSSHPVIRSLDKGEQIEQHRVLAASSSKRQALGFDRKHTIRQIDSAKADGDEDVPEEIEEWKDAGMAVQSTMSAEDITKMTEGITTEVFTTLLHELVDPAPTRFIAFKGNKLAARNIKTAFEDLGLTAELQKLGVTPQLSEFGIPDKKQLGISGNVVGFLKGGDLAHEVVIVGSHYDSVNWDKIKGPAPGVDDNGSGVALMLLLAKEFSQAPVKPRRSLLFVSFQAEEEGLVGSSVFAKEFKAGGEGFKKWGTPVAALVADEVAWPGSKPEGRKVIFETKGRKEGTQKIVDTLAHASQEQCKSFKDCTNGFVVNYNGFGSDHISLLDVGIPAVLLIERDNMYHADTWGHTDKDTFDHIDAGFGAANTRMALQAVAALANPK